MFTVKYKNAYITKNLKPVLFKTEKEAEDFDGLISELEDLADQINY